MSNLKNDNLLKRVIIVTKDNESRGGVANFFRLFFRKFNDNLVRIERFDIGSKSFDYYDKKNSRIKYIFKYIHDLIKFIRVLFEDVSRVIVHVNPSLIPVPLVRDGILLLIAKIMGRKVIVFFRGWDEHVADTIGRCSILLNIFVSTYARSNRIIVLAERFKEVLVQWGMEERSITVMRTMFDGELVLPYSTKTDDVTHFLFLSRISEEKGVVEIIDAATILKSHGLNFCITFVGYGKDSGTVEHLKTFSQECGILDLIKFKGYLDGKEKFKEYAEADVFLLPSYQEGCPNSVLEAMASGLFVISSDVGALGEIVRDGVNGRIVWPKNAQDLAEKMEWVIKNLVSVRRLGQKNRDYAFANFESKKIVHQIKELYKELLFE